MSIETKNVVDLIGVDKTTGEVILTISDHLRWSSDEEERHLWLLQDKINCYLSFIESGEINEAYPNAQGRAAVILIHGAYPQSKLGLQFFEAARNTVIGAGFDLRFKLYPGALAE